MWCGDGGAGCFIQANEMPQVSKSGWMIKKSRGFHDLIQQKRWFVLIGSSLYYYKENTVNAASSLLFPSCKHTVQSCLPSAHNHPSFVVCCVAIGFQAARFDVTS
jgi:hypothetical protein